MYIVIGGHRYEGDDANTLEVFKTKEEADDYGNNLCRRGMSDFFTVVKKTIEHSATPVAWRRKIESYSEWLDWGPGDYGDYRYFDDQNVVDETYEPLYIHE